MIIAKPEFKVLTKPDPESEIDLYRYIEQIGRTCYKSENMATDDSASKFISRLNSSHHWAMLEHYIFRIVVPTTLVRNIMKMRDVNDPDIQKAFDYIDVIYDIPRYDDSSLLIASATALNTLRDAAFHAVFKYTGHSKYMDFQMGAWSVAILIKLMHGRYPLLINDTPPLDAAGELLVSNSIATTLNTNSFRVLSDSEVYSFIKFYLFSGDYEFAKTIAKLATWFSVRFIVNRGVSHELVRHRPASYAQESTRYCNYSKDKFGNEITCICPFYYANGKGIDSDDPLFLKWKEGCEHDEKIYFELLDMGATPQQARGNLPTDLKTEIVCTASLNEWIHIFDMRCDKATAHPQIVEVMEPLSEWMKRYYEKTTSIVISNLIK